MSTVKPRFSEDLADLILGLQVPVSIDGERGGGTAVSGVAQVWRRIWGTHLRQFGWKTDSREMRVDIINAFMRELQEEALEYVTNINPSDNS